VELFDISKRTVSPTFTVFFAGKKAICAMPLASLPARTTLPCGPSKATSFFASFVLALTCLATRRLSAFLPGTPSRLRLTVTVSFLVGCSTLLRR
jgi:hypothetical protein